MLVAVAVATCAWHAADAVAGRLIKVEELARDKQVRTCDPDFRRCVADLRSTLRITPELADLGPGAAAVAPLDPEVAAQRQHLLAALEAYQESVRLSATIVDRYRELVRAGRAPASDPNLQPLSDEFEAARRRFWDEVAAFIQHSPMAEKVDASPDDRVGYVLAVAGLLDQYWGAYPGWIADQLQRLDAQAAADARAVIESGKMTFRLGAFRHREGAQTTPLHLPGYDDYPAGVLRPRAAISFALTPAQKERLQKEVEFNASAVSLIRDFGTELERLKSGLRETQKAVAQSVANAEQVIEEATSHLDEKVKADLEALAQELKATPEGTKAATALQELRTEVDRLRSAAEGTLSQLRSVGAQLAEEARATDRDRPDLVLEMILGRVSSAQANATSLVEEIRAVRAKVEAAVGATQALVRKLPEEAGAAMRSRIEERLKALRADLVDAVLEPFNRVAAGLEPTVAYVKKARGLLGELQVGSADAIVSAKLAPSHVFDVPVEQAAPTSLPLETSELERGDVVEIVAELRRAEADSAAAPVGEDRYWVETAFFGWSSDVAAALGFVRARDKELANFEPAPVASWRISYRQRPEDHRWLGRVADRSGFGIGIHAIALDFDPDNSVEFGAGVNISLFKDMLEIGYGWNLNTKGEREYWFIGLRLFELLKK